MDKYVGYTNDEIALCHYGIKGMRWGIRRFQKEDGSLTPAGRKRYDDDNNTSGSGKKQNGSVSKSKHRQALEKKFKDAGLSEEEAAKAADKRIRSEKILAASAAIAVTACAAYVVHNKVIKERTDGLIKAGEKLQRVEMQDTGGKLHDTFYLSKGKHDNARYEGMLGQQRKELTGKAYLMQLEAGKDIKVASNDKAAKIFGDLYKNDSDFRRSVKSHVETHFAGHNQVRDINDVSNRNIRKMYDNFNSGLMHIRAEGTGADKKFYSKLKEAGYGAIQDINDRKYSGYNAKNPLIVFDNSNNNIMVKTVKDITTNGLDKKAGKEYCKLAIEQLTKTTAGYGAAGLTTMAVSKHFETPQQVVDTYRRDHPLSKKTDAEILKDFYKIDESRR